MKERLYALSLCMASVCSFADMAKVGIVVAGETGLHLDAAMMGVYSLVYSFDGKGRMIFPSRLRDEIGAKFYITRWLDNCLAVFSEEEFIKISEKIAAKSYASSRKASRTLFSKAFVVAPDKQGRILIPQQLREYAHLDKEVAVIGVLDRAEIWDKDTWLKQDDEMTPDEFEELMMELDI